jgi:hypothetical protein
MAKPITPNNGVMAGEMFHYILKDTGKWHGVLLNCAR